MRGSATEASRLRCLRCWWWWWAAHVGGGGGRICGRVGPSPPPRWTTGDPDKVRAAPAEMEKQAVDFVIQAPPTNIYNIYTNVAK